VEARACVLSDKALGSLVTGHTPRLPLETDPGVPEEVCLTAVGAMGLPFTSKSTQLQGELQATATSQTVGRTEGWNGMVVKQNIPSLEDASMTALVCSGVGEPSSASLPSKISWQRWCLLVCWALAGRDLA
jgi:hypothetical protein